MRMTDEMRIAARRRLREWYLETTNRREKMPNVYEGQTDGRQSDRIDEPVSRFRPRYRALTEEEKALHDKIKATAEHLEQLFHAAGKSPRYNALALTSLEQAVMWAVKGLTS